MFKTRPKITYCLLGLVLVLLALLATALLPYKPATILAGTIAGNFTTLAACPQNLTSFVVDPTTGYMYGQGDQNSYHYYRYNPSTNTWTSLADCPVLSGNNGGATYMNGKIYNSYCSHTNMTVYDIATNSWSTIAGGLNSGNIASDGTDIYISANGVFKKWDISESQWVSLTATTTQPWGGLDYFNGYLYSHDGNGTNTFKRYNIALNVWENLPNVPGGAVLGSAIFDAYYYCMGSYSGTSLYSYDLGAGEWNNTLTLPFSIDDSSIEVYNNSLYIVQGEAGTGFTLFTPNNPILSGIEGGSISYSIGDAPVNVTSTITGEDNDDTNFESGIVSIISNFESGKDVLAFTNQNGITGSWNSSSGVLTLTGSASIADWVTALRSITYSNSSMSSTTNTRVISFQVNDGGQNSNVQSRSIIISIPPIDIRIEGNSMVIADGDTSPSLSDHTDFGSIDYSSGNLTRTFTIWNGGSVDLALDGDPLVALSGAGVADFTVILQPSSTITVGNFTTFQISFDPSTTGIRSATVSISNNDPDEDPYDFSIQGRGTSTITVTGVIGNNKVYDGNTDATIDFSGALLDGIVGDDDVSLVTTGYTANFTDKSADTGKAITIVGLTLAGTDASNYTLIQPSASANITQRLLTINATGINKTYDGTTTANVTLADDCLPGDVLVLSFTNASFANKHIGSAKTVSISGISVTGTDAENYTYSSNAAATADIIPLQITVTVVADNKTYDGTIFSLAVPEVTAGSLLGGDTSDWSQTFDTRFVGSNKTLTPAGIVNDGNNGQNYTVTFNTVAAGTITQKEITVTGITAADKTYDGTTTALLNTDHATLVGLAVGDNVTLDVASAAGYFSDANVGNNKTVVVSGLSLGGTDSGNYTLVQPTVTANIVVQSAPPYVPVTTPTPTPTTPTPSTPTPTPTKPSPTIPTKPVETRKLQVTVEDASFLAEITNSGIVQGAATFSSPDGNIVLNVPDGTRVLTDNTPTLHITIMPDENPPPSPEDKNLVGVPYECLPHGTTFDPPVTLTWDYDPATLPDGIDVRYLQVAFYNTETGKWEPVASVIDTVNHTIKASITHFSTYAVIGSVNSSPQLPTKVVETITEQPSRIGLIVILAVAAVVLVIAIFVITRRKKVA